MHSIVHGKVHAFAPCVVTALFMIGLYFPSSVSGEQSAGLLVREMVLLFVLFGTLAFSCGIGRFRLQLNGCLILLVIVACTFLSPFGSYAIGAIYIYVLLVFLYNLNLQTIQSTSHMRTAFGAANIINLVLGIGIILQSDAVTNFLQDHYTYFYPELLATMFALRKPVLTFGSHSVAAFYTFLFFWMNLKTFEREKRWVYLFLAVTQTVFSLFLFSFTSFFFFACELVMLISLLLQRGRQSTIRFAFVLVVVVISAVGMLPRMSIYDPEWNYHLVDYATSFLTSTENGPVGRYSSGGDLAADLKYLGENPLRPVGLSKPNSLFFMDSGPVEYLLRGSLPLLLLIYGGLYIFLCDNMTARRDALALFIVIVLFETGFPILLHLRTLYLLPFFVVYMNGLRITPKAESLYASVGRAAIGAS